MTDTLHMTDLAKGKHSDCRRGHENRQCNVDTKQIYRTVSYVNFGKSPAPWAWKNSHDEHLQFGVSTESLFGFDLLFTSDDRTKSDQLLKLSLSWHPRIACKHGRDFERSGLEDAVIFAKFPFGLFQQLNDPEICHLMTDRSHILRHVSVVQERTLGRVDFLPKSKYWILLSQWQRSSHVWNSTEVVYSESHTAALTEMLEKPDVLLKHKLLFQISQSFEVILTFSGSAASVQCFLFGQIHPGSSACEAKCDSVPIGVLECCTV